MTIRSTLTGLALILALAGASCKNKDEISIPFDNAMGTVLDKDGDGKVDNITRKNHVAKFSTAGSEEGYFPMSKEMEDAANRLLADPNDSQAKKDLIFWERVRIEGIPEVHVRAYDDRFKKDIQDLVTLHSRKINPAVANAYDERFTAFEIWSLANVPPELANKYPKRFSAYEIDALVTNKVTPEIANAYDERFGEDDIRVLQLRKISPETANPYHPSFSRFDIIKLQKAKLTSDIANKYGALNAKYEAKIGAEDITYFINEGTPFETIEEKSKDVSILRRVSD